MMVFDADGHILEPEEMFNELEPEFYPHRPVRVSLPFDTYRGKRDACWLIGGQAWPSMDGRGPNFFLPGDSHSRSMSVPVEYQTLADVEGRLKDMDRYGIDKQIVFPTLFLIAVAEEARLEAAYYRAYNNFVGRACARSGGRLKWAALIPFRDPELAQQELRRASDLGASAILTLGMVWDRCLNDPAFSPIFQGAADLDLPVCVHFGWGSPVLTNLFTGSGTSFCSATTPVLWAFYHILLSGVLDCVPKLRVGFLESGGGWVPYLIDQVRRRLKPQTVLLSSKPGGREVAGDPLKYFEDGRLFVACESDEDLPYLVSKVGEDSLMLASDYPHADPSADEEFVKRVMGLEGLTTSVKEKLLGANAERFFRS